MFGPSGMVRSHCCEQQLVVRTWHIREESVDKAVQNSWMHWLTSLALTHRGGAVLLDRQSAQLPRQGQLLHACYTAQVASPSPFLIIF